MNDAEARSVEFEAGVEKGRAQIVSERDAMQAVVDAARAYRKAKMVPGLLGMTRRWKPELALFHAVEALDKLGAAGGE